jgi:leucyl/phenylalanyl-tRNA--protein transferase
MTDAPPQADQPLLTPRLLIAAYCQGAFPMAPDRHSRTIHWFSPARRGIIPLEAFNCPRSVGKHIRDRTFDIRFDSAFDQVIHACAAPRQSEQNTWISNQIISACCDLHVLGLAHSVEAWRDGQLVGGLYGVAINGAFFGESMFHRADRGGTDASKVCLVHLVEHLNRQGYRLLDTQWMTDHLRQFGGIEIDQQQYMARLAEALRTEARWAGPAVSADDS